jgi:hypothetical protein
MVCLSHAWYHMFTTVSAGFENKFQREEKALPCYTSAIVLITITNYIFEGAKCLQIASLPHSFQQFVPYCHTG